MSPARTCWPRSSKSVVAVRAKCMAGVAHRNTSSTAVSIATSPSRTARHWSGKSTNALTAQIADIREDSSPPRIKL